MTWGGARGGGQVELGHPADGAPAADLTAERASHEAAEERLIYRFRIHRTYGMPDSVLVGRQGLEP